ncbi:MAG TPA: hypothetical protein VNI57_02325 [Candidatus Saccharimonadales bacterium]|nr:hypothetical protein [Candidatus Saccharimonadales bacterium]
MTPSRLCRLATLIAALGTVLFLAGCFDAPLEHRLDIYFHGDGSVEVSALTRVTQSWRDHPESRVADRIDAERDAILHGEDLWSRAVRAMAPAKERIAYDYEKGALVVYHRQGISEDPRSIEKLFTVADMTASLERENRTLTLEIAPDGASRATMRQRREVAEALESFSGSAADYLGKLAALYRYLETAPDRSGPAIAALLDYDPPALEGAAEPGAEERRLVGDVKKASESLMEILTVKEDEAYTVDEMSRLVYDPFPAPVVIEITGEVIERAGFDGPGSGPFESPRVSLWDALESLEGRWVTPLPAVAQVEALRKADESETPDDEAQARLYESLVAAPRRAGEVPDAGEVRAALEEALRTPDDYRLKWRLPSENAAHDDEGEAGGGQ